jgi:hypothetical protein
MNRFCPVVCLSIATALSGCAGNSESEFVEGTTEDLMRTDTLSPTHGTLSVFAMDGTLTHRVKGVLNKSVRVVLAADWPQFVETSDPNHLCDLGTLIVTTYKRVGSSGDWTPIESRLAVARSTIVNGIVLSCDTDMTLIDATYHFGVSTEMRILAQQNFASATISELVDW